MPACRTAAGRGHAYAGGAKRTAVLAARPANCGRPRRPSPAQGAYICPIWRHAASVASAIKLSASARCATRSAAGRFVTCSANSAQRCSWRAPTAAAEPAERVGGPLPVAVRLGPAQTTEDQGRLGGKQFEDLPERGHVAHGEAGGNRRGRWRRHATAAPAVAARRLAARLIFTGQSLNLPSSARAHMAARDSFAVSKIPNRVVILALGANRALTLGPRWRRLVNGTFNGAANFNHW